MMFYTPIDMGHGEHHILWQLHNKQTLITGIVLAEQQSKKIKDRQQHINADISAVMNIIRGRQTVSAVNQALKLCDFSACTPWQQLIWSTLAREVKAGSVISYGGLAEKLGRPGAARSVGSTMAKNRFPLLIPCHRVVASGGRLGGFMNGRKDGLKIKRELLAAEHVYYIGTVLQSEEALIA